MYLSGSPVESLQGGSSGAQHKLHDSWNCWKTTSVTHYHQLEQRASKNFLMQIPLTLLKMVFRGSSGILSLLTVPQKRTTAGGHGPLDCPPSMLPLPYRIVSSWKQEMQNTFCIQLKCVNISHLPLAPVGQLRCTHSAGKIPDWDAHQPTMQQVSSENDVESVLRLQEEMFDVLKTLTVVIASKSSGAFLKDLTCKSGANP